MNTILVNCVSVCSQLRITTAYHNIDVVKTSKVRVVNNIMAEAGVKQVLEREITCPLCLDLFKQPKKLPCDHVYCKECLRGLALRSLNATISCPECRTLTQVPGNDVNNFPTAFHFNRLIEAFQQVQLRVEPDSPTITEICQAHPTQSLALYCESCKKQLCRDCVLMAKEHADHKYGFFKEVAPKYRERLGGEMSLIKTQGSSISSALGKIVAAETSVANHTQKCQDDIEHAFEEMISVLQACKQVMKDEATAYYSSLTGIFDQQKERLKDIQGKLNSAVASVDTSLQDDDQSFLMRMESTFERISNLQRKFQTVSLTVAKPQLITVQTADADSLKHYMKANCFICNLAQADMCSVDGSFINAKLSVDQQTSFILTLCDSNGVCQGGENKIDVDLVDMQGSLTKGNIQPFSQGQVMIFLTPMRRGEHQLNVKVNGAHIKNSPFTVTVYMPPSLLSRPVATISGLGRPASLVYSQTEDKILATIMEEDVVIKVDSQLRSIPSECIMLHHVSEITHDADLNIFYATTTDNQLHKLNDNGSIIKTVGQLGKKNVEFNYPNGLRVSKKRELYVCDSDNNRVQVFDLDLNFKRSFGKKGTGKGQFNFPADIKFDSSGNIYVTDISNNRIQVFTCTERHIRSIENQRVDIFQPVSLLLHNENIYVTDGHNHQVWVMNTSGEIITTFGGGYLEDPEGITVDKAGFVYVTSHYSKIVAF